MTLIRVNCLRPECADAIVDLTTDFRPGMMAGRCARCGTAWRMKSGELHEIVAIERPAPPPSS